MRSKAKEGGISSSHPVEIMPRLHRQLPQYQKDKGSCYCRRSKREVSVPWVSSADAADWKALYPDLAFSSIILTIYRKSVSFSSDKIKEQKTFPVMKERLGFCMGVGDYCLYIIFLVRMRILRVVLASVSVVLLSADPTLEYVRQIEMSGTLAWCDSSWHRTLSVALLDSLHLSQLSHFCVLSSLEGLMMHRPSGLPQGDTRAFVSLNNSECVPCYTGSPFLTVFIKEEWGEKGRGGNACACPCIHKRAGRDLGWSQLCSLPVFICDCHSCQWDGFI